MKGARERVNFLVRSFFVIKTFEELIQSGIPDMEISINLIPSMYTHCLSYRSMNREVFVSGILEMIDMWLNVDSHIYQDPKVCKDFRRSNRLPR